MLDTLQSFHHSEIDKTHELPPRARKLNVLDYRNPLIIIQNTHPEISPKNADSKDGRSDH